MKRLRIKNALESFRSLALLASFGAMIVSCGDASDPEAVSRKDLASPGDLSILDNGNGEIKLTWRGANFEDDFDGYNVYGMKDGGDLLGGDYVVGSSVKFLDDNGDAIEAAKTFIAKFNFDPKKPFEEKATSEDEDQQLAALPVHQDVEEPVFPTCGHDGEGVCKDHGDDFKRKSVDDETSRGVSGPISYSISGLTPGSTYCFFVLASLGEGEKVSSSSTNIECVTPRYKLTGNISVPASSGSGQKLDLQGLLSACQGGDCGTLSTSNASAASASSDIGLYVEEYQSGGLTAGKYTGLVDLGYYPGGFEDPDLREKAAAYEIGATLGTPATPINSTGGYAPYGETLAMKKDHIYVIAVPDGTPTETPTSFYYHWIHVIGTGDQGSTTEVDIRLGSKIDER